ncbi:autotransporter outer membrane beta-barrel domain-containing protein, partial [Escherichia coli]|nr:autotransporter outer membrane beta-barrel domain-containing protein [Escherichia coli]EET1600742.1 autotransporter outer membrane beta-barrel domain-containing protein [Escherichia coli]EET2710301.1 autotransporter outer membrane beta-barrel domain-containing protein [Escherichia coli]EEV8002097.1 autotransporter outer membrane beta-barrel domain-containing protein [Escherichia coli]EFF7040133.1 autotransporter outer membrane beta-barrel domain-containing protein [Escherichia coli]
IAVSELSGRVSFRTSAKKKKNKLMLILCCLGILSPTYTFASRMDASNFYIRDYLDFAQNKGIFQAGATNIEIIKKDGSTLKLPEVPFPDFSPVANKGSTTSIGGAYSITATHNTKTHHSVAAQNWGNSTYKQVDWYTSQPDFAVSRLDKYVVETRGATEGADTSLSTQQALERYGVNYKGEKKLIAFRAGSGKIGIRKDGNLTPLDDISYKPEMLNGSFVHIDNWSGWLVLTNNQFDEFNNLATQGDSGSALFVYDNQKKKWVVVGTAWGVYNYSNGKNHTAYSRWDQKAIDNLKKNFSYNVDMSGVQQVTIENGKLTGTGSDTTDIKNKDLIFTGGGNILLKSSFDNGAGGLVFNDKKTYQVNGEDFTFKGAGVDTRNGSTVEWNIRYDNKDNLHKIGNGTLDVRKSQNTNLKIGEGLVILGAEKTFNNIYMASGDGTVKLNANNALNGDDYAGVFFTENGGTLDLNGYDQVFKYIAATDSGTTITNTNKDKPATLSINNTDSYIYHGNITGNTKITHSFDQKQQNDRLILDGNINTTNDISIKNAHLVMQGHATNHAVFRDGGFSCSFPAQLKWLCGTDYVAVIQNQEKSVNQKQNTDYKTNNLVSDLSQPDWERRTFNFGTLHLENADFAVARNADVKGNIYAKNSSVMLGSDIAYIDLHSGKNIINDGFSFRKDIRSGISESTAGDLSSFTGRVVADNSTLAINNKFLGEFTAENKSKVSVKSRDVVLNTGATISNDSTLTLEKDSRLTANMWLMNSGTINVGENAELNIQGYPIADKFIPSIHDLGNVKMTASNATLTAGNYAMFSGELTADNATAVRVNLGSETSTLSEFNPNPELTDLMFDKYNTSWTGKISALKGDASMVNTVWRMTGDSGLNTLKTSKSLTVFSSDNKFSTLTVNDLTTSDSTFVLRSDSTGSDKVVVKNKLEGKNNNLLVDYVANDGKHNSLNFELVSAPKGTAADVFNSQTQNVGFSDVTPVIEQKDSGEKTTWTLKGFNAVANQQSAEKAENFMSAGYKNFLAEVNNLNKRMGDLRDINGEAGAWARIMSGTGSASGGFSDNYTHVQVGVDKKHELDGLDLFTGFTVTHTDSSASADVFSGKTKSVGAGLYASAMFDSGAYIDLIGKYVHHDNEYTATFAGLGTRDYSTHSWYAGAEAGYRYHVTEDAWIEPQAELVYGSVSGKQFAWKDQGMHLSMKDKDYNPLIGRTGVDVGKSFSGKDWKVTARAGLGYQFDLLANGETVLRDASGEKRIKGEKDSRMLMSVGLNAEIRDNVRFGLEFEKSAFGKYNVDNAVNANFRYSF